MKAFLKNRWSIGMLAGTAVFAVLFVYATPYVSGTDQYWHINYIDSILKGNYTSGELYPAFILDPAWNGSLTGFIHNMPVLYIWAVFAWVTGSLFHGAIAFNALCAVLSAWFVYLAVRDTAGHKLGAAAYLIMLSFPLAFWQCTQLLTETSAMLFFCAALYLFGKKSFVPHLAGAALLALSVCSRTNVLLLALMLLAFSAVRETKRGGLSRGTKAAYIAAPAALFAAGYVGLGALFGASLDFTVSRTALDRLAVVSTFGEIDNMALHYSLQHFSDIGFWPMVGNFAGKLWTAVVTQFGWTGAPSVLYWLHNLLFIAAAAALALLSRKEKKALVQYTGFWVLVVTIVSWAISSTVYQNQFRYNLVYMPLLTVVLCVCLHRLGWGASKRFGILMLAGVLLMAGLDAGLAYTARADAISEHAQYTTYQETFNEQIPPDTRVVFISPQTSLLWPQLLYPRITTVINPTYTYTEEQIATLLLGRCEPNEYIVTAHAALPDDPAYKKIIEAHFTLCDEDEQFDIYQLAENS